MICRAVRFFAGAKVLQPIAVDSHSGHLPDVLNLDGRGHRGDSSEDLVAMQGGCILLQ